MLLIYYNKVFICYNNDFFILLIYIIILLNINKSYIIYFYFIFVLSSGRSLILRSVFNKFICTQSIRSVGASPPTAGLYNIPISNSFLSAFVFPVLCLGIGIGFGLELECSIALVRNIASAHRIVASSKG